MASERRSVTYCRIEVAAERVGLPAARVRRYLRAGLVRPVATEGRTPLLGEGELARLRRIRRLADDLGLNQPGVEVALRLLDQIETLQAALAERERRA